MVYLVLARYYDNYRHEIMLRSVVVNASAVDDIREKLKKGWYTKQDWDIQDPKLDSILESCLQEEIYVLDVSRIQKMDLVKMKKEVDEEAERAQYEKLKAKYEGK